LAAHRFIEPRLAAQGGGMLFEPCHFNYIILPEKILLPHDTPPVLNLPVPYHIWGQNAILSQAHWETLEEAISMAKEAIRLHIECLTADGEPVPEETVRPQAVSIRVAA
jgi:hypothetical protein